MISEKDIAFPRLTDAQIASLEPRGRRRAVRAGEVLIAEGDRGFGCYVVLNGAIEMFESSRGDPHTIVVHALSGARHGGCGQMDRALRSGRCELHRSKVLADPEVGVELPAQTLVEANGAVDVGYRNGDGFELQIDGRAGDAGGGLIARLRGAHCDLRELVVTGSTVVRTIQPPHENAIHWNDRVDRASSTIRSVDANSAGPSVCSFMLGGE